VRKSYLPLFIINKSEQASSDGLGYIPIPWGNFQKGEQGFNINNRRKWPST